MSLFWIDPIRIPDLNKVSLKFSSSANDAAQRAEKLGLGFIDHGRFVKKPDAIVENRHSCLPRINEKVLHGQISHVNEISFLLNLELDEFSIASDSNF